MRKKYVALAMGMVMTTSLFTGCGSTATTSSEATVAEQASDGTIYGEIESIEDDSITINIGNMKEMDHSRNKGASDGQEQSEEGDQTTEEGQSGDAEQTEDTDQSQTEDAGQNGDQSQPDDTDHKDFSMLDLTGETMEITVTDDTSIVKQSRGFGGQAPSGDSSNAPEKPEGASADGEDAGTPPEKPEDGSAPDGASQPPADANGSDSSAQDSQAGDSQSAGSDQAEGDSQNAGSDQTDGKPEDAATVETEEISLSDLSEDDIISVTTDADGNVTEITLLFDADQAGGMAAGGQAGDNQAQGVDSYTAVTEYNKDTEVDGDSYESTGSDENAILVSEGAAVTLNDVTVDRISSDSTGGDNSSFYGVGAAILTTDGVTTINRAEIITDSKGGAGVFAYGEDAEVYVNDSTITTTQDTSGGIHVAGGGSLYASNLTVETSGESSAAIRSDRGGGKMEVEGGTYTSKGTGSPAVYSTADIEVSDATLTAENSEAVCIEGRNSLTLSNCDLTGNIPENEQNDCNWNVILYQSMSGDSEVGNATFTMEGGSLTAKNGGMFYTTNTESTFNLEDVDITYADQNDFFLRCTGNQNARGWGSAGSNGAQCTFYATDQEMQGDIIWDSISTLDFNMSSSSTLTGAVIDDESCAGDGGEGYCNLTIDEDSTWIVTGDSSLTKLSNQGKIVDEDGNAVTIKGSDGTTYVEGSSQYTITVESYE